MSSSALSGPSGGRRDGDGEAEGSQPSPQPEKRRGRGRSLHPAIRRHVERTKPSDGVVGRPYALRRGRGADVVSRDYQPGEGVRKESHARSPGASRRTSVGDGVAIGGGPLSQGPRAEADAATG